MQLLNLSVHNLGVFRGCHSFDLAVDSQPSGVVRHITLVTGHNGAGKSTLFQALALALHGRLALGDRISRQGYSDFLLSHLYRRSGNGTAFVGSDGGISLDFQYVQSGQPLEIHIERNWERSGSSVLESLKVLKDGEPPDVDPSDLQTWLNDLVSPGLSGVLFFDAERLNALADPQQHSVALGQTWRRVLGLDLVDRLQADLGHYTLRWGGGRRTERLRAAVLERQAAIDALNAQFQLLQSEATRLAETQMRLTGELAQEELHLAAEGGSYAERRPVLQERLSALQLESQNLSARLHDLAAGLLPFSLAPELCRSLSRRLDLESEARRYQIAQQAVQERVADLEAAFGDEQLWQDLGIAPDTVEIIKRRLVAVLRDDRGSGPSRFLLLHHFADADRERMQGWITEALRAVPQQINELGERLKAVRSESRQIEKDLSRVPDDAILAPIHSELMRLQNLLSGVQAERRTLDKQLGALQFQIDDETRQLSVAHDRFSEAQAAERELELAERSKLALRAYRDALVRRQVAELEERIATAFQAMCRKERMLSSLRIDPDDFHVELRAADDHEISLADFATGERQLYALSVLWALRQVSGCQLPLMIDTPLARLDEVHRERLVNFYFPLVSGQVLLFATQAEFDRELLEQLQRYLARTYLLRYESAAEETVVTTDRFAGATPAQVIKGV